MANENGVGVKLDLGFLLEIDANEIIAPLE
jgi:hypothetical protein